MSKFKTQELKTLKVKIIELLSSVFVYCRAQHSMRHTDNTWERPGWLGAVQMVIGRFSEVGSRISWVRWTWFCCSRMLFVGKCLEMTFRSTGISLVLVSAVPLHRVRRCILSSVTPQKCEVGIVTCQHLHMNPESGHFLGGQAAWQDSKASYMDNQKLQLRVCCSFWCKVFS